MDVPDEPAWATLSGRLAARAAVEEAVAAWTLARDAEEIARLLQEAGISAMAVLSGADLRADEHLEARGALVTLQHAEMGEERHSGDPLRMSRTPLATPRPAPLLGEHTADVLTRWLGIDAREVAEMAASGVCC